MRLFCAVVLLLGSACTFQHLPEPTHYLPVGTDLELAMTLPGAAWHLSRKAPPFVAQRMTDHLRQELSAAGHSVDEHRLLCFARQRLSVNEGFVANAASDAYLMIDFRPRRQTETAPSWEDLQGSAHGALLTLENERGISNLKSDLFAVRLAGGIKAYRVEARYLLDGQNHLFIGIIGYRAPYRFYFYYNDFLPIEQDQVDMEQILNSMQLQHISGAER